MEIRHTYVNGLPVFVVPDKLKGATTSFGAVHAPEKGLCYFPAFPPFLELVLEELHKLQLDIHEETRIAVVKEAGSWETFRQDVSRLALPTKSYEHQLDGLADLLYNRRWALQWEMGTGKSKVVVDALMILRVPALILGSRTAISNWPKEFRNHSDGSLKVLSLDGSSVRKKKRQLQEAVEADVVLATYDAARLYGVPTLYTETATLFKRMNLIPNPTLRKALMDLNDEEQQLKFAREAIGGRPNAEIIAEVARITQALPTCLAHLPYQAIFSDESHRIKHIQSRRTRFCLQLSAKAKLRYLLTGTMSDGDPRGLYPQLMFLAPYLMPDDWDTFCKKHIITAPGCKHIVVQYKNIDVLNKRVDLVSSTKLLDECVDLPKQLPPVTVYYDLSPEQRKEYNRAAKDYKLWREEDSEELELSHSAVVISKLLQICSGFVYVPEVQDPTVLMSSQDLHSKLPVPGHDTQRYSPNPKLAALMEMLEDMLNEQKTKVIVWANYTAELDDIEAALKQAGVGYVRVDGSNSIRVLKYVEMFQNDPKITVYLAQEMTGESITLTAAKWMIYYSRSWYLDAHRQSKKRNYRIGQTQHTGIYYLVAAGTTEEQQLTALEHNITLATMLTQHHNCAVCVHYSKCLDRGVQPWDNDCVLEKDPHRVVTKPTPLKEDSP